MRTEEEIRNELNEYMIQRGATLEVIARESTYRLDQERIEYLNILESKIATLQWVLNEY